MPTFSTVITELDQVDPEWLTHVLAAAGALQDGAVSGITMKRNERRLFSIGHLSVDYAPGSRGPCPRKMFLKVCRTDLEGESIGPSEVNYYARDYVGVDGLPLLPCYNAVYSAEKRAYHILLDDVSDTHRESHGRTLTLSYGLALADGLARMHAHWWGIERLSAGGELIPTAAQIERYVSMARAGLESMLQSVRGQIDEAWEAALHDLFAHHPAKMIERAADAKDFTLVHGDPNPGNILAPLDGDTPIYLIDRQPFDWSLTTWLGVSDLAYAMVHWWHTDVRRELEGPILRRYHQRLLASGVTGYSWQQLMRDYRLSIVNSVYVATEWCRSDDDCVNMKWAWLPMLQRAMVTFFDHDCAAIWRDS